MNSAARTLPNIWGAGQLLAFSGIDGETDWTQPFVLHTEAEPGSFSVRLPITAPVGFSNLPALRFSLALGDALAAESDRGSFRAAFLDKHALIGEKPEGTAFTLGGQNVGSEPLCIPGVNGAKVCAVVRGNRWALLLDPANATVSLAERREQALTADLDTLLEQRTAYVRAVAAPAGLDAGRERLLRKALSVMKVNIESPCGRIKRQWSTPDRWPHRHMWLWDSAFHGIGFAAADPATAQEIVLAMLEQVQPEGMLPHMVSPIEPPSSITQPPVLAWSVFTILQRTNDLQWASRCAPYLFRYLEWIRVHRDRNDNGLPEWAIEGDALCRSGESGMDNSPRFDHAALLDAVDFASFLCADYRCLAAIAERLGDAPLQERCTAHAARIATAVNDLLWSPADDFYCDRDMEGNLSEVKAVSGFMPLFAGIADPARAEALRRQLANPETFAAPAPIPSISLDAGRYSKDMWRGPMWVNMNYLTILGLRRYGFQAEAARLREATLDAVQHWYEKEGCLFEFYDSLGITSPRNLDRKQRLITGKGMAPISDYHWTAALTAAMLLE